MNIESIPEIIKDVDCLQETQQHSVVIEHNWCIGDICDLIKTKRPGEKIESEQFSYRNTDATVKSNDCYDIDSNVFSLIKEESPESSRINNRNDSCKLKKKSLSSNNVSSKFDSTINQVASKIFQNPSVLLHSELACDYFLNNSLWRLEIAQSTSDTSFVCVNLLLFNSFSSFIDKPIENIDSNLVTLCKNCEQLNLTTQLKLKLKFYLFNGEMNDIYNKQVYETNIDLKKFISSLAFALFKQASNKSKPRLIEKISIDKFCPINDLLKWLNRKSSNDFSLLVEFKIYSEAKASQIDGNCLSSNAKNRLKKKLEKIKAKKSETNASSTLLPDSTDTMQHRSNLTRDSILALEYKHVWTIKNWQNFLMSGTNTHMFMNDLDISNIFSAINDEPGKEQFDGAGKNEIGLIKFEKLRSKYFKLYTNENHLNSKKYHFNKSKIETLLKDVKWKLQLYPNGYNKDFEQNLSLFVNFSQLTGDLAQFSPTSSIKKSHSSSSLHNKPSTINQSSISIEETFYDSNEEIGLILLMKTPSSNLYNHSAITLEEEDLEFDPNNPEPTIHERKSKRKSINQSQFSETFVKASFQICILDSNGKKVDKSQSEKQLFELHGSWGYKEYLTAMDLLELKEKYLTKNYTNLNLNCKIVLFYTVSVKTNLNTLTEAHQLSPVELKVQNDSIKFSNPKDASLNMPNNEMSLETLKECNTLLYDLKRLFNQSDMFDLIIKAPIRLDVENYTIDSHLNNQEYKQFKVHKLILSVRSEVFEKMFNKNNTTDLYVPNELEGNVLNIIDFDAFIVEAFLNYLYTDVLEINLKKFQFNFNYKFMESLKFNEDGSSCDATKINGMEENGELDDNEDNKCIRDELFTHLFIELYKISDKYCVYRLKSICEKQLLKLVTVETCVELLILSFLHNSTKVKQKCLEFLSKNVSNIITQANWIHLEKHYPSLLAEAFRFLFFKQRSPN